MRTARTDRALWRAFRFATTSRSIAVAIAVVWALLLLAPPVAVAQNVSFTRQVAPLLVRHCGNCHVAGRKGGFQMQSYAALMTSGMVQKGAGQASRLVEVIETGDMPRGGGKVSRDELATIIRWIDSGAACDAADPAAPLDGVARPAAPAAAAPPPAGGRARSLSDADLSEVRRRVAPGLWKRAIPDEEPVIVPRERLVLVGNLPAARMDEVADLATRLEERIRGELVGGDAPLVKGGIVLYVFRQGYDYSAFWQIVLNQERPKGVSGHAGVVGDLAYGAFLMPGSAADPTSIDVLVAEQIAGAALAGRNLPHWFVTGAARVAAGRVMPKALLVQEWRRDAGAAARELGSPSDFFAGHGDPAATATAAAGFVTALASPAARLKQLVAAIDDGMPLDDAVVKLHRGGPQQLYETWLARQKKPRR